MSLGLILVIILIIFLLGGFSGRFGGYGYGFGHGGVGIIGTILVVVLFLVTMGRLWQRPPLSAGGPQDRAGLTRSARSPVSTSEGLIPSCPAELPTAHAQRTLHVT